MSSPILICLPKTGIGSNKTNVEGNRLTSKWTSCALFAQVKFLIVSCVLFSCELFVPGLATIVFFS